LTQKLKTAKNSKLRKLRENYFEPVGKGGWPLISTWMNNLITKIIVCRMRPVLFQSISEERFGFLHKRWIHDVVMLAQEALHSMVINKLPSFSLNIDLSKSYDRVSWMFLILALVQIGFERQVINLDYGMCSVNLLCCPY
jgi:hypothetical protein